MMLFKWKGIHHCHQKFSGKITGKILLRPCFVLFSLLISIQLIAAEEDFLLQLSGDEEMISIATGTPQPVSSAPAVTTVITAADIRASGAVTLQQVLEQVPGLHVITSIGKTQNPTYAIRGINTVQGPQTLFLVNGREITFLMTGNLPSGLQFPLQAVARIEIMRGPGSAVYGADAFSGIINIITKTDAELNGIQLGVKAGSFGIQSFWAQYGGMIGEWHVAASLEHTQSDGDDKRIIERDLQTLLDGAFGTSASNAPGPLNTDFNSLTTNFTFSKGHWTSHFNSWNVIAGAGAGVANALDPTGYAGELEQYLADISYEDESGFPNLLFKTQLSHLYSDSGSSLTIFPAGAVLPIGSDGNFDLATPVGLVTFTEGYIGEPGRIENTTVLENTFLYSGFDKQLWRINFGYKIESFKSREVKNFGPSLIDGTVSSIDGTLTQVTGTPYIYLPDRSRKIAFSSIQNEWDFMSDWRLTAGIRYDDYSDFGGTTNPRLSLVWNTRHDLTTKLLYGRAFRAPSVAESAGQNNPIALGNADIDPETMETFELVFDYRPAAPYNGVMNLFYYQIEGLIDFVDDDGIAGGSATAQNIRDQKATGMELVANWQPIKPLRLFGSLAVLNAWDAKTGDKVPDVPRQQLHIGGRWNIDNVWSAQMDVFRIMDRPRPVNDSRSQVADYSWINVTLLGKNFFGGMDLQLGVRNLLNADVREPAPITIPEDYPQESRSITLSISVDL